MNKEIICNLDDIDPISLLNIREVSLIWLYSYKKKTYGYDAWQWLEFCCRTKGPKLHPIFRHELELRDIHSLFTLCKNHYHNTPKTKKKLHYEGLLKQCQSKQLDIAKVYNTDNELIQITPYCRSPLYKFVPIDITHKYNDSLSTFVKCTAKIVYVLYDYMGEPTNPITLYL